MSSHNDSIGSNLPTEYGSPNEAPDKVPNENVSRGDYSYRILNPFEWDPPADSEELKIALFHKYPRERSLEDAMQRAIKEAFPSNSPTPRTMSRVDLSTSQPSATGVLSHISPARTSIPQNISAGPGSRSHSRRRYTEDERVRVKRNRKMVCADHKKSKTACDPKKCKKNLQNPASIATHSTHSIDSQTSEMPENEVHRAHFPTFGETMVPNPRETLLQQQYLMQQQPYDQFGNNVTYGTSMVWNNTLSTPEGLSTMGPINPQQGVPIHSAEWLAFEQPYTGSADDNFDINQQFSNGSYQRGLNDSCNPDAVSLKASTRWPLAAIRVIFKQFFRRKFIHAS